MNYKRMLSLLLVFGCFMATNVVSANDEVVELDNEETIAPRAAMYFKYRFDKYPPKTYKGLTLRYAQKLDYGSYVGMYI
ncbi:hypothetical protein [Vagococcus fluvialis]|uniref:hypothetical protein n=1 Tax=Vagococcus fluvialis TaxID=2738 RepID=UPI001A9037B8|nr:hypothetical protein [Vagococcus fluvialis]MBO0442711.1 hypothetical protein [Vagococcus fluvialis]